MPRYFFNTENGELVCDAQGEELPDEAAARREAVMLMGAILRDEPEVFLDQQRWRMVVAEAHKGDLFTLEMTMKFGEGFVDWTASAVRSPSA